jgi:TP901 family phage tail tape measure protein
MPSARELFIIVRANDEASRQLRQVGSNLRFLSKETDFAAARTRQFAAQQQFSARQLALQARQANLNRQLFEHVNEAGQKVPALLDVQTGLAQQKLDRLGKARILAEQRYTSFVQRRGEMEQAVYAASAKAQEEQLAQFKKSEEYMAAAPGSRGGLVAGAKGRLAQQAALFEGRALQKIAQDETRLQLASERAGEAFIQQGIASEKLALSVDAAKASLSQTTSQMRQNSIAAEENAAVLRKLRQQELMVLPNKLAGAGRAASFLGQNLQFAGGIGLAGLGFAANSAAALQTSTQLAATQAGSSLATIEKKGNQAFDAIIKQMQRFPATSQEMSQSLYDIFSGTNVQGIAKGTALLALFNKAAVGGQASLNTVTQAGLTVMNAYGLKVSQMPKIMNQMFSAVRFGRTNMEDFGNSLNQLVPAFESANQSTMVMFGSLAFLTRRMPSVRMAATSLARATEVLGNAAFVKGMHQAGVEITNAHHALLPLPEVIGRILQKFPQLGRDANIQNFIKTISGMSGTIQARRALTFLFRDFGAYQKMLHQVSGDTNEFGRSFSAMTKTQGNQWKVFINSMKALWLELGKAAIPTLVGMSKPIVAITHQLENMSPQTKSMIGQWAALSAAGLLLMGTFSRIVGIILSFSSTMMILNQRLAISASIGRLVTFLRMAQVAFVSAGGGAAGLRAGLATLATTIGPGSLLLVGLAAVGAAVYILSTESDDVQKHLEALGNTMKRINQLPPLRAGPAVDRGLIQAGANAQYFHEQLGQVHEQMQNFQPAVGGRLGATQAQLATVSMVGRAKELDQAIKLTWKQQEELNKKVIQGASAYNRLHDAAKKALEPQRSQLQTNVLNMFKISDQGVRSTVQSLSQMTDTVLGAKVIARVQELGSKGRITLQQIAFATHQLASRDYLAHFLRLDPKQALKAMAEIQAKGRMIKLPPVKVHADTRTANKNLDALKQQYTRNAGIMSKPIGIHVYLDTATLAGDFATMESDAAAAAGIAAANMKTVFNERFKRGSPSKWMIRLGQDLMTGLVQGIASKKADFKSQVQSVAQAISTAFDDVKSTAVSAMGTLFSGPLFGPGAGTPSFQTKMDFGAKLSFGDVSGDLRTQVSQFRSWRLALQRLAADGFPPGLIQQLMALGPAAMPEVLALVHATRGQRKSFVRLYRQQQGEINSMTRFGMSEQMKVWKQMGKSVAFGFLAGLRSESPAIVRYLRKLMQELFHTVQHHNKSHSPSRLYFQEGVNMMTGLQMGMDSVGVVVPGVGFGSRGAGGVQYHYHQHLQRSPDTSERAFLRMARWDYERHIPRRRG